MSNLNKIISNFLDTSLFDTVETAPCTPNFYGSQLPLCPRQLVFSKMYPDVFKRDLTLQDYYDQEVGNAAHKVVQNRWMRQGLLWGDWKCDEFSSCGVKYHDQKMSFCVRCGSKHLSYKEKKFKDPESLFSGKCDGIVFGEKLKGYVIAEIKSKTTKTINNAPEKPAVNDLYQVSAYATLADIQLSVPIVGRLILWVGRPRIQNRAFWFLEGLGKDLYYEQVNLKKEAEEQFNNGDVLKTRMRCKNREDARGCSLSSLCFNHDSERLILKKYNEFRMR